MRNSLHSSDVVVGRSVAARVSSLRVALVICTFCLLGFASEAWGGGTNVVTNSTSSTVTTNGWIWNTYAVTVSVTIHYDGNAVPAGNVYYPLNLWEDDIIKDNKVAGPLYVCIAPADWQLAMGGPRVTKTLTFAGVSGWYGDDWYVDDTDEVACDERYTYVGGSFDRLPDDSFAYAYTLINDPTGIAMVNGDPIVSLTIGELQFDLDVPLARGDSVTLTAVLDVPPALELQPFVATYQDGAQVTGLTLAPSSETPFVRGDSNSNHTLEISDVLTTLNFLFLNQPIPCADAADINDDGAIGLTDVIAELNFLFLFGTPPSAPFPGAGQDTVDDFLDCEQGSSIDAYLEDHSEQ